MVNITETHEETADGFCFEEKPEKVDETCHKRDKRHSGLAGPKRSNRDKENDLGAIAESEQADSHDGNDGKSDDVAIGGGSGAD